MKPIFFRNLIGSMILPVGVGMACAAPVHDSSFVLNAPLTYSEQFSPPKLVVPAGDGGYYLQGASPYQLDEPCGTPSASELGGFKFNGGYHRLYPLIKIGADGRMDCEFKLWAKVGNVGQVVLPDGAGKVYVADSAAYGISLYSRRNNDREDVLNTSGYSIARFHENDGALDGGFILGENEPGTFFGGSFVPPGSHRMTTNMIEAAAFDRDGLVVGGQYRPDSAASLVHVWRLNADGSKDAAFHSVRVNSNMAYPEGYIRKIAVLRSGKILVAGGFNDVEGAPYGGIIRLNPDGTLDESFKAAVDANGYSGFSSYGRFKGVMDFVVRPDGKIIVVGGFSKTVGDRLIRHIARLHPDGTLDASFTAPAFVLNDGYGYAAFKTIALQSDNKMIIASGNAYNASQSQSPLMRLNADGSVDEAFRARSVLINNATGSASDNKVHSAVFDQQCRLIVVLGTDTRDRYDQYTPALELPLSGQLAEAPGGILRLRVEDASGCIH